jgi:hypothetical protein
VEAVRWLARLGEERDATLRDIRLAANALEALKTKHHDLAEKMLLRFLGGAHRVGLRIALSGLRLDGCFHASEE